MQRLTESELRPIRSRCDRALGEICWKYDATTADSLTLPRALEAAKIGKDMGLESTRSLQPLTDNYNDWMDYAFMLTILYNRNRSFKKYTILRKELFTYIWTALFVYLLIDKFILFTIIVILSMLVEFYQRQLVLPIR